MYKRQAVDIAGRLAGVKNIKVVAGLKKDNDKKPKQEEVPEKAAESSKNVEAEENQ